MARSRHGRVRGLPHVDSFSVLHYYSLIYLLGYKYLAAANKIYLSLRNLVADCYVKCKIFLKVFNLLTYKVQLFPSLFLIHLRKLSPIRTYDFCKWGTLKLKFLICSLWDNLFLFHLDLFAAKLFVKEFIYLFSFKIVYFNFNAQIVLSWLTSLISYKVFTSIRITNTLQFIFNLKDNCKFKVQFIYVFKDCNLSDLWIKCFYFQQFLCHFKFWLKSPLCDLKLTLNPLDFTRSESRMEDTGTFGQE